MKENKRKSTIQLAIWTWTWVATLALASFGPRFIWDENPIITTIAIIINVTMGVMMIIANRNFFNHSDELERKIQMIPQLIAEAAATAGGITGSFTLAIAGAGAALGIGMIGAKAVEAVGRNPGASGKVLTLSIIGMALSEAIAIYALILAFGGR